MTETDTAPVCLPSLPSPSPSVRPSWESWPPRSHPLFLISRRPVRACAQISIACLVRVRCESVHHAFASLPRHIRLFEGNSASRRTTPSKGRWPLRVPRRAAAAFGEREREIESERRKPVDGHPCHTRLDLPPPPHHAASHHRCPPTTPAPAPTAI